MKIGRKSESKTFYSNIGWENNVHNTSVPYYIDLRFTKSYACFMHIINYSCAFFSAPSSTKFNRRKTPFHYLLEYTLLFPPNSLSLIYIHTTPQIKAHLVFSALFSCWHQFLNFISYSIKLLKLTLCTVTWKQDNLNKICCF